MLVSNVGLFVVVDCPVSASVVNPVLENIHTLFLLSMAILLFILFTLCLSSHRACCGLGFRTDPIFTCSGGFYCRDLRCCCGLSFRTDQVALVQ